jgi:nucleotide-binding universal stress UspA family protein
MSSDIIGRSEKIVSEKIVVGVDSSASSAQALRWAARQAALTHAVLHAVIAWNLPDVYGYVPMTDNFDWEKGSLAALQQTISDNLEPAAAELVHQHAVCGHPASVLLDCAADADLLVVGSRGHGGFAGMLLGSISQYLVTHAPCPVVVLRVKD